MIDGSARDILTRRWLTHLRAELATSTYRSLRPVARMMPGVLVEQAGILDRRIDLRGTNTRVTQHFLNRAQISAPP
jgi:hypothetical protein